MLFCVLATVVAAAVALLCRFADADVHRDDKLKILVVDDHPITRKGVRLLLSQEADLEVCAEAESVDQAIRALEHCRPDLAIVDLYLKGSSGLDLIKYLAAHHPAVLVVVLSMRDESFYAERALEAGARAYITKEDGTERLIEGIRKVLMGQVFVTDKIAARLTRTYTSWLPL
jgi:DNA-binding NarL/FixJ family response regulator